MHAKFHKDRTNNNYIYIYIYIHPYFMYPFMYTYMKHLPCCDEILLYQLK